MAQRNATIFIRGKTNADAMMKRLGGSFSGVNRLAMKLGLTLSVGALAYGLKKVIDESNKVAVVAAKLRTSFKNTGGISEESAKGLETYAEELERLTGIDADQTIAAQAMLGTFNLTAEQAKKLTMGLLDTAVAGSTSATELRNLIQVAVLLGKSTEGMYSALTRVGIIMTENEKHLVATGDQMVRVNTLIKVLDKNFGGAAVAVGQTFYGAQMKAKHAFGTLMESMGDIIVHSGAVREAMIITAEAFTGAAGSISDDADGMGRAITGAFLGGLDAIHFFLQGLNTAGQSVRAYRGVFASFAQSTFALLQAVGVKEVAGTPIAAWIKGAGDVALEEATKMEAAVKRAEALAARVGQIQSRIASAGRGAGIPGGGGGAPGPPGPDDPDAGGAAKKQKSVTDIMAAAERQYKAWRVKRLADQKQLNELVLKGGELEHYQIEQNAQLFEQKRLTEVEHQQARTEFARQHHEVELERQRELAEARQKSIEQWVGGLTTVADVTSGMVQASLSQVGSTIADQIVDGTADWLSMSKSLLKLFIQMTIQLAAMRAIYAVLGSPIPFMFHGGGLVMHKGGLIPPNIPSHHSGDFIRHDERMAKLQAGEYVVNRNAAAQNMDLLNAMNYGGGRAGAPQVTNQYYITVHAIDAENMEQVVITKIIPALETQQARGYYDPMGS